MSRARRARPRRAARARSSAPAPRAARAARRVQRARAAAPPSPRSSVRRSTFLPQPDLVAVAAEERRRPVHELAALVLAHGREEKARRVGRHGERLGLLAADRHRGDALLGGGEAYAEALLEQREQR